MKPIKTIILVLFIGSITACTKKKDVRTLMTGSWELKEVSINGKADEKAMTANKTVFSYMPDGNMLRIQDKDTVSGKWELSEEEGVLSVTEDKSNRTFETHIEKVSEDSLSLLVVKKSDATVIFNFSRIK